MIHIDSSGLDRAQAMLQHIPGAAAKATKTALKKTVRGARQEASKKVRERYTIKAKYITRTLSVSVEMGGFVASFKSKGRVNDLAYFKHKPGNPPKRRPKPGNYLHSEVVQGEGGPIRHAFLAGMQSGHVGVFRRTSGNRSLPIEKLSGPSTPQMLGSPSVAAFIQKRMMERLDVNVTHEVNAFLMGYRT